MKSFNHNHSHHPRYYGTDSSATLQDIQKNVTFCQRSTFFGISEGVAVLWAGPSTTPMIEIYSNFLWYEMKRSSTEGMYGVLQGVVYMSAVAGGGIRLPDRRAIAGLR